MPGHDHVGLAVGDLDVVAGFYGEAFGLTEVVEEFVMPDAGVRSRILRSAGGVQLELVERAGSTPQRFSDPFDGAGTQGWFHWALRVPSLDEAFDVALTAGATVVSAPADGVRAGMRFAYVADPEGNLVELLEA